MSVSQYAFPNASFLDVLGYDFNAPPTTQISKRKRKKGRKGEGGKGCQVGFSTYVPTSEGDSVTASIHLGVAVAAVAIEQARIVFEKEGSGFFCYGYSDLALCADFREHVYCFKTEDEQELYAIQKSHWPLDCEQI